MRIIKKDIIIFFCVILFHQILVTFTQGVLYPIHYINQNIFFLDLIGVTLNIPLELLFFLDAGNIILLWLISKLIFANRFTLIPPIIYAISPWSSYLVVAGSFYMYLSFLLLLTFYGLLLIRSGQKFWGSILATGAMGMTLYSSFLLFIIFPPVLILMIILRIIPFSNMKIPLLFLITLMLILMLLIYKNPLGFKNISNNEIKIFSDPGLLNMVNSYQGAAKQANLSNLAKISENRYLFSVEYILLKFTKQFVPSTYFTSQEKLLNFSFSPPIYLGFLIPFVFGVYQILKSNNLRKLIIGATLLVIPSIAAKSMVDLNRLFLFSPIIIFVISFGLVTLLKQIKKKITLFFLIVTIFLLAFQFLVTISDISLREKERFIKYFEQNYEIGKQ